MRYQGHVSSIARMETATFDMIQHAPCQNQTLQPKSFQIMHDNKYIGLSETVGGGDGGLQDIASPLFTFV